MHRLFNNILIPLNLRRPENGDVENAIQMAAQFNCDVHLLHVSKRSLWPGGVLIRRNVGNKVHLLQLRERYAHLLQKGRMLHAHLEEGNPETIISEYATIYHIDLILAIKQARLDIERLASKTSCAILNLLPDPLANGIRNIVLPVGSDLPLRRILMATYLSNKFNAAVHVIALSNHVYLQRTFQLLRENTNLPVNCTTMVGENIAKTTLEYAKRIDAGLILDNPGKFMLNQSQIPVITVA